VFEGAGCCVMKSTNGGATWLYPSVISGNVSALAIDPKTPTNVYAGTFNGEGIHRTTDGGSNWNRVDLPFVFGRCPCIYSLAIDPVTPTTIYAGGFDNVFK